MTSPRIPAAQFAALALGLALAFNVGCGSHTEDAASLAEHRTQAALPDVVQKAVAIARDLESEESDVEAVLERHGLDLERFEAMMYEISSDPELSRAYTAALK